MTIKKASTSEWPKFVGQLDGCWLFWCMKWNSVLTNGYWARYAILGTALLWLSLLALIFVQQDIPCPGSTQPFAGSAANWRPSPHVGPPNGCGELRRQLDQLRVGFNSLEEENRQLKKLAASRDFRPVEPGQFLLQRAPSGGGKADSGELRKVDPLVVAADRRMEGQLYTKEHELARRELLNGIWELYRRVNGPELRQSFSPGVQQSLDRQFDHLLAQSRSFSLVNRAGEWHKKVLDKIGQRIQESLERLQNPSDCAQARLMLCELNKGCGFGCQLHHLSYCLIMAAAANRTLLLERDGAEWRYSDQGWTAVFRPLSKCSWEKHVSSTSYGPAELFTDFHQAARIVRLPIVDGLVACPQHLPLAFPFQFADLLLTHHSNPPVFFIAQFLEFIMRENEQTREFVQKAEKQVPFELGPVVGVQVRRTDKVGTEAAYHSVEEYLEWADLWFRVEQIRMGFPLARRVFIATDDPAVIVEAREKYGSRGWTIFGNDETAQAAQPGSRYSDKSLLGVIADVRLLSRCSYIVCTFSSQVCRMGYELMQSRQGEAGEQFHSLDDIFYFGGQLAHEVEAAADFKAEAPDQMDLLKGDTIGIAGNHWDGWSKGSNRRTGKSGLFPSFLAREKWRIVDFPIFDN